MAFRFFLLFAGLLLWCPMSSMGAKLPSICGHLIVQHDPGPYTIGRLATTGAYDPQSGRFYFPTVASVGVPEHQQSYLMNVFDGVMRTGAARFSEGIIRPMEVNIPAGKLISDLAIVSIPQYTAAGPLNSPVTGIVEASGSLKLFFAGATQAATHIVRNGVVRMGDYFAYELDAPRGEPFRSLALVKIAASDANLRVLGLTDHAVYQLDLHTDFDLNSQLNERQWVKKFARENGRYLRAAGPNTIVVGDERSSLDLWHNGQFQKLGEVSENWLFGFDAFITSKGEVRILTLSSGNKIHFYDGNQFSEIPLEFPEGEIPLAISASYLRHVDSVAWDRWKGGSDYNTGHLSERVEDTARRIMLLTRKGSDYQVRGVQGIAANQLRLSNFPWYYVSDEYPPLVKALIQAGFKLDEVSIDVKVDIGALGEKIGLRLRDAYGFGKFDPNHPEQSKGNADVLVNAWRNRLRALRDLRLTKAQVSSSIAEEGIVTKKDQMLVYELMALEDQERIEEGYDIGAEPDNNTEWLALFQLRLANATSPLVQPMHLQYRTVHDFYEKNLKGRPVADLERFDISDPEFENIKPLYLLARNYFARPFKYLVWDFLEYCERAGLDRVDPLTPLQPTYWMALADYLDERDPLRRVVDEKSLLNFLLGK